MRYCSTVSAKTGETPFKVMSRSVMRVGRTVPMPEIPMRTNPAAKPATEVTMIALFKSNACSSTRAEGNPAPDTENHQYHTQYRQHAPLKP